MGINERLKHLRKDILKMTLESFGAKIHLSRQSLSNIENGNRSITDRTISDICREFDVNEEWLRTGEGPEFVKVTRAEEIQKMVDDIMRDRPEAFRRRFVTALAALDESGWIALENFIDSISDQKEIDTRKRLHDDLDRQLNEEEDLTEGSEASPAM
jgi:transcriptional regulator with XRE-family HTH domain